MISVTQEESSVYSVDDSDFTVTIRPGGTVAHNTSNHLDREQVGYIIAAYQAICTDLDLPPDEALAALALPTWNTRDRYPGVTVSRSYRYVAHVPMHTQTKI